MTNEELISNIGGDLNAMALREDKTIYFPVEGNVVRCAAHETLASEGVVSLRYDTDILHPTLHVTLLL